jgi:hypothetical protein
MTPASTDRLPFENRRPHGISTTEGQLVMKSLLLGATVLMGLSVPAWATSLNDIRIDATTAGSVNTLSITQDDHNLGNQVSGDSGSTTALPVKGPWKSISIDQHGSSNKFYGSLKADATSGTAGDATLTASYSGGNNIHSLTIGTSTTAPVNPTVHIAVTGGGSNTITDTLDGGSLTYNLALAGTGNSVINDVAATGAILLNQGGGGYGITGDNNSVTNTVSGVASFTHNLALVGNNNTIANTAINGGDKTITQNIDSAGNTVTMTLDAAGTQDAALTVGSSSKVDYTLLATAAGGSANINLSNVIGAASAAAVVNITKTAAATGSTANLMVFGGGFTMGTALPGSVGANVYQNSPAANLSATVTANANGYTANFVQ